MTPPLHIQGEGLLPGAGVRSPLEAGIKGGAYIVVVIVVLGVISAAEEPSTIRAVTAS